MHDKMNAYTNYYYQLNDAIKWKVSNGKKT